MGLTPERTAATHTTQAQDQSTYQSTDQTTGQTADADIQELLQRKEHVITHMGGLDKIEAQHQRGRMTARERILALLDPGTFMELGALAHSERSEVAERTPGDGKIVGLGKIQGRKVGVGADDVTVSDAPGFGKSATVHDPAASSKNSVSNVATVKAALPNWTPSARTRTVCGPSPNTLKLNRRPKPLFVSPQSLSVSVRLVP